MENAPNFGRSSLPFKRWLMLGLTVLLVHLGLLGSMPLTLNLGFPADVTALSFATRTIVPVPVVVPPAAVHPARPRVRQAAKAAPELPAPALANDTTGAATGSAATTDMDSADELASVAQSADRTEAENPAPAPGPPAAKPPSFHAAALTGSTKLIYRVHVNRFPFTLNGELLWRKVDTRYTARLSFSAFGQSRTQTSQGQITDAGLAPERFSDKYRSEVAAHFNYPLAKVSFSANTPDAPLLPGAQDRLSVLVQLGALVASEPERYRHGMTLTIPTVGPRDADLWMFTFGDIEALELPGGTLQGIKLVRNPRQPYDQKVEVWLAAQLGYLPARIRITDTHGDAIDQQWLSTETADDAD